MPDPAADRSWYAATAHAAPPSAALEGAAECDVCIVGAGYTGLSAALHLAGRGYRVAVLEQGAIGAGASGRNGGQLGSGLRREQPWLERRLGEQPARLLWDLCEQAKSTVRDLVAAHRIDCDLKPGLLHAGHWPRHAAAEQRYAEWLRRRYGYEAIRPLTRDELRAALDSPGYHGGSLDLGAGHLHPLNYLIGLAHAAAAAGVRLYTHTRALGWSGGDRVRVRCAHGEVSAGALVLACNGYLGDLEPRIAGRIMPINNFIVATEPLGDARARALIRDDAAVADSRFVINYFRLSSDRRLLFGGGENYSSRFPADIAAFVRPRLERIFPQLRGVRIDYGWGGTLAITMTRLPDIGRLAGNVLYAQGYSGHGVALATFTGKVIAEALAGTLERFDLLAHLPTPMFPGGRWLRQPLQVLGMTWYALRDRL
ncbi:MAG: NAD(P)/FAD-dependent oxidoreductase [Gammaproteobacteria bacterium]